jgi:hypothetical protein
MRHFDDHQYRREDQQRGHVGGLLGAISRRRAPSKGLLWALALSFVAHSVLLAAVTPPPRTQPRYVVLEARLKMDERQGDSDFFAGSRNRPARAAPGPRGPVQPQSPTPLKKDTLRAISDLTLPHDSVRAREFAPGFDADRQLASPLQAPLPEPARYFRASELEVLAEPLSPVNFDRLRFTARKVSGRIVRLRVFINEAGRVDDIRFEDQAQAHGIEEEVRREFMGTQFFPALRTGRAVKSQKLIELYAAGGG